MGSERRGVGAWRIARLVAVGVPLVAALSGCVTAARSRAAAVPESTLVFRNLSAETVWVFLDGHRSGPPLGSVPSLGRAHLRIPGDLARADTDVRLTVVRQLHVPGMTEKVAELVLPIEEVRVMEWTLAGSTLTERPLRVPLAGAGERP